MNWEVVGTVAGGIALMIFANLIFGVFGVFSGKRRHRPMRSSGSEDFRPRNNILIAVGTTVTAILSMWTFGTALAYTGTPTVSEIVKQHLIWSAALGCFLALFWDRNSENKMWIILIPPAGLMTLMIIGTLEELAKGNVPSVGLWLLTPIAIALPAILIPSMVNIFARK